MEINTDNQFQNDITPVNKRSQFLSAICILTWVCCGLMFLSTVYSLFSNTPEKQAESIEAMRQFNPETADKMEALFAEQDMGMIILNNALGLIALGLSAMGAYLMWQLKKKGFYIYLAGEIIPYTGFLISGKSAMGVLDSLGSIGPAIIGVVLVLMLLVDAVFVIMYAVNLKYMDK